MQILTDPMIQRHKGMGWEYTTLTTRPSPPGSWRIPPSVPHELTAIQTSLQRMKEATQRQYLVISDSLSWLLALKTKSSGRTDFVCELLFLIKKENGHHIPLGFFPYWKSNNYQPKSHQSSCCYLTSRKKISHETSIYTKTVTEIQNWRQRNLENVW